MRGAVVLWLAALLALPAAAREGPLLKSVFHRRVTAPDGTALALYRYVPDGGGGGKPAVLLVPEVGFGRGAYDFAGAGLARYLQERGRDVFVAELRGQGQAQAPRGWSLGQWISLDLPAVLDAVSAAHPGPVDVVVHGYSGGLVLAACAVELKGRVRRVVALSPVVLPEVPNATVAKVLREGGGLGRLARERAADFELLFTRGGRISPGEVSRLRLQVTDLSPVAARELFGWMVQGDLPLPDGSTFARRLPLYDRPTLALLAMQDNFAHPEFGSPLRELSPAEVKLELLTRLNLLSEDYTHLSLLHGADAPSEIFGPLVRFLDKADRSAQDGQDAEELR